MSDTKTDRKFTRRRTNRLMLRGVLAGACLAIGLVAVERAEAASSYKFSGGGWGHGIGMSQYGAAGYASQGWDHERILSHYYTGTDFGTADTKRVRVLLGTQSAVSFSSAKAACGADLDPRSTYRAVRSGEGVAVQDSSGSTVAQCARKMTAKARGKIRVEGHGTYRGKIQARPYGSSSLNVINRVALEKYLRGVVPNEAIPSWPTEALAAQAVVARSYALATRLNGDGWDMYDDTRSQAYKGFDSELDSTTAAVKATKGKVVTYKGQVATTYFFSASGGHTASNEDVWGGNPVPYLRGVRDEGDSISPHHSWSMTFSSSDLASRLSGLYSGSFEKIRVTDRAASGHIVRLKVVGSSGSQTISGDTLRYKLGLKSTNFSISS